MSSKLDLDISLTARMELRWQDTASFELVIKDEEGVVQSLAGSTLTLELYKGDYESVVVVTAVLDEDEEKGTFIIDQDFWENLSINTDYSFRIRRAIDDEIKTFINGDIIIC